jgi:hypothetical protein
MAGWSSDTAFGDAIVITCCITYILNDDYATSQSPVLVKQVVYSIFRPFVQALDHLA